MELWWTASTAILPLPLLLLNVGEAKNIIPQCLPCALCTSVVRSAMMRSLVEPRYRTNKGRTTYLAYSASHKLRLSAFNP
jgi:hypothetical protein